MRNNHSDKEERKEKERKHVAPGYVPAMNPGTACTLGSAGGKTARPGRVLNAVMATS